jgi:hypothetical protein
MSNSDTLGARVSPILWRIKLSLLQDDLRVGAKKSYRMSDMNRTRLNTRRKYCGVAGASVGNRYILTHIAENVARQGIWRIVVAYDRWIADNGNIVAIRIDRIDPWLRHRIWCTELVLNHGEVRIWAEDPNGIPYKNFPNHVRRCATSARICEGVQRYGAPSRRIQLEASPFRANAHFSSLVINAIYSVHVLVPWMCIKRTGNNISWISP